MNIAICDDLSEERAAIAQHLHTYFSELTLSNLLENAIENCHSETDVPILDISIKKNKGI